MIQGSLNYPFILYIICMNEYRDNPLVSFADGRERCPQRSAERRGRRSL